MFSFLSIVLIFFVMGICYVVSYHIIMQFIPSTPNTHIRATSGNERDPELCYLWVAITKRLGDSDCHGASRTHR